MVLRSSHIFLFGVHYVSMSMTPRRPLEAMSSPMLAPHASCCARVLETLAFGTLHCTFCRRTIVSRTHTHVHQSARCMTAHACLRLMLPLPSRRLVSKTLMIRSELMTRIDLYAFTTKRAFTSVFSRWLCSSLYTLYLLGVPLPVSTNCKHKVDGRICSDARGATTWWRCTVITTCMAVGCSSCSCHGRHVCGR